MNEDTLILLGRTLERFDRMEQVIGWKQDKDQAQKMVDHLHG